MRVLLDTCVVSEIRHPKGAPQVKAAVAAMEDADLFLSVITLGEIRKGIQLLSDRKRQRLLGEWLDQLLDSFSDRVLPVDASVATTWGKLTASCQQAGLALGSADGLIVATAVHHHLTLYTRNVRHFEGTGARIINPWE